MNLNNLLNTAITASLKAGERILEIYNNEDFDVDFKSDDSPLTKADTASHNIIMQYLEQSGIPVLSEEGKAIAYETRKDWEYLWIVDPIDGTKEFIKKNGEFTVNIALVENGRPVLGVVYRPVNDILYLGVENAGAWRIEGGGHPRVLEGGPHYSEKDRVQVVASRSHLTPEVEAFVEELRGQGREVDFLSAGSSLKLCLVAEGAAHVYPRFGPTMEWDTGAAHAVVLEAGRKVINLETGEPLSYNKPSLLNPWFVVE